MKIQFSDRELELLGKELSQFKIESLDPMGDQKKVIEIHEGLTLATHYSSAKEGGVTRLAILQRKRPGNRLSSVNTEWICNSDDVPQLKNAIAEVFNETT